MIGLKENVIIGKLIPAGTGMKRYRNIQIHSDLVDSLEPPAPVVEEEKEECEWLVETPNPSYTGLNVTIEFKNGKGTTKNKVVAEHFEAKGYKVTKL